MEEKARAKSPLLISFVYAKEEHTPRREIGNTRNNHQLPSWPRVNCAPRRYANRRRQREVTTVASNASWSRYVYVRPTFAEARPIKPMLWR